MMKINRMMRMVAIATFALSCLVGCSGPKAYNVDVSRAASLADDRVQVDIVAVGSATKQRWQQKSIDVYFSPGDPMRADTDKHTMAFQPGGDGTHRLPIDANIWGRWLNSNADTLFIIADLPGNFDAGGQDPRRLELPLARGRWNYRDTLAVTVQSSGVTPNKNPESAN